MNIQQLQRDLDEARRLRDNTSVKIYYCKQDGKDYSPLEKEIAEYRNQVAKLADQLKKAKEEQSKKPEPVKKKATKTIAPDKTYTKAELDKCLKDIKKIVDESNWEAGYQMRCSECMFIKDIKTETIKNGVALIYTLQYKTNAHRIEKTITKEFNPDTVKELNKYMDKVEVWVMNNSGDMDNRDIVFGPRFNQVQFDKQNLEKQGWVIYK